MFLLLHVSFSSLLLFLFFCVLGEMVLFKLLCIFLRCYCSWLSYSLPFSFVFSCARSHVKNIHRFNVCNCRSNQFCIPHRIFLRQISTRSCSSKYLLLISSFVFRLPKFPTFPAVFRSSVSPIPEGTSNKSFKIATRGLFRCLFVTTGVP